MLKGILELTNPLHTRISLNEVVLIQNIGLKGDPVQECVALFNWVINEKATSSGLTALTADRLVDWIFICDVLGMETPLATLLGHTAKFVLPKTLWSDLDVQNGKHV